MSSAAALSAVIWYHPLTFWAEDMHLKRVIGRAIPYQVIEQTRRALYYGNAHTCFVCGAHVRRFLPQGKGYPVLEELQVIGGMARESDVCPVCHANDRDRLIKHYLESVWLAQRPRPSRVVHMAPEKGLSRWIMSWPDIDYTAGDIEPRRYRHLDKVMALNLLALPFGDGSVDLFLCNHVLEHIPDDGRAMREVRRVLGPRGIAILQVPLALEIDTTREGDGSESRDERIQRFGQEDHVRLYSPLDYQSRLAAAGFEVELYDASKSARAAMVALSLNPREILYVCRPA